MKKISHYYISHFLQSRKKFLKGGLTTRLTAFAFAFTLTACGVDPGEPPPTNGNPSVAVRSSTYTGPQCPNGGITVETGIDDNGNGLLDSGEVDETQIVCHGTDGIAGIDGIDGTNGTDGTNGIDGTNGANGTDGTDGTNGSNGTDGTDGTDGANGTDGTDGTNGSNGLNSLIFASTLPIADINCENGGLKIEVGLDDNGNGVLDPTEIDSTSYICNGTDGLNSLILASTESAGSNCGNGGVKVEIGLDSNNNGILDPAEVGTTSYVCDGADGINGLNSLIFASTESAGSNCGNGGVKVDVGLDDNSNGVLDSAEIDTTSYVCNGADGGSVVTYTVGGSVSGLTGSGLVLQNNGGNDLSISTGGAFLFTTALSDSSSYNVTVSTQPSGQTCTVTNGSGAIIGADITNVTVTCAMNTYTVGGNVSGLAGSGLVLQNNGGNNLSVSADGAFTFTTALTDSATYLVTVSVQPSGDTCTVTNGSGTISGADVTNVTVTCAMNTYTVGGDVNGLTGSGLVLQNNGGNDLSVNADGAFTFSNTLTDSATYNVTVSVQPSGDTCTVTNGGGTISGADVTNVTVTCAMNTYTVGGDVSGLTSSGLVLQNNGGNDLSVNADGAFTFSNTLSDSSAYNVTVSVQPSGDTCTVTNGGGAISGADVTNVTVTCATNTYTVGGDVSGLTSSGLVLQNNGGNDLSISADGAFAFTTALSDSSSYDVTVSVQPSGDTCTVTNGSGAISGADVTNVTVTCAMNTYTVGGDVSGLASSGLVLQNNGGNDLSISADGAFTFTTALSDSSSYDVTVSVQPSGDTCTVTNGSGTISGADVTNVTVTCAMNTYTVGGDVSGLASSGLVLQNNGGNDLFIGSDGAFTFTNTLSDSATYNVTVSVQPSGDTCTVTNGSGTISGADVTNVTVTCAMNTYTVGGYVSGLTGSGLVLQNDGGNDLSISADGAFTFTTALSDSSAYNVTVSVQPSGDTCTVTNGSGTISGADVTNVTVTCTMNTYTVGGYVSGLTGSGLVLQNNGGNDLSISANGSFTFTSSLGDGSGYNVTVSVQPSGDTCTVTNGSGTISGADVTNVTVTCAMDTYAVGGDVSGLTGSGLVLQNNGGDDLFISADGAFTFTTALIDSSAYDVTVSVQPFGDTCTVANGSGTISGADVTNVTVSCAVTVTGGFDAPPMHPASDAIYDNNEFGLITATRLQSWRSNWSANKPAVINGKLKILQVKYQGGTENFDWTGPYVATDCVDTFVYGAHYSSGTPGMEAYAFEETRNNGLFDTIMYVTDGDSTNAFLSMFDIDPVNDMVVIAMGAGSDWNLFRVGRIHYMLRYWGMEADHLAILNGSVTYNQGSITTGSAQCSHPSVVTDRVTGLPDNTGLQASTGEMLAVARGDYTPSGGAFLWDTRSIGEYSGNPPAYGSGQTKDESSSTYVAFEGTIDVAPGNSGGWLEFTSLRNNSFVFYDKATLKGLVDTIGTDYIPGQTIYTWCRTAYRAMHAYIAASVVLGYPVKVYDGSWIEWGELSSSVTYGAGLSASSVYRADTLGGTVNLNYNAAYSRPTSSANPYNQISNPTTASQIIIDDKAYKSITWSSGILVPGGVNNEEY